MFMHLTHHRRPDETVAFEAAQDRHADRHIHEKRRSAEQRRAESSGVEAQIGLECQIKDQGVEVQVS